MGIKGRGIGKESWERKTRNKEWETRQSTDRKNKRSSNAFHSLQLDSISSLASILTADPCHPFWRQTCRLLCDPHVVLGLKGDVSWRVKLQERIRGKRKELKSGCFLFLEKEADEGSQRMDPIKVWLKEGGSGDDRQRNEREEERHTLHSNNYKTLNNSLTLLWLRRHSSCFVVRSRGHL